MDSVQKYDLARTGDTSKEAAGLRLRAARTSVGLSQLQLGQVIRKGKSAINNMEMARSFPSLDVMSYLFREHRIDFNFVIAGEYAQLPGDVQDRLFLALEEIGSAKGLQSS